MFRKVEAVSERLRVAEREDAQNPGVGYGAISLSRKPSGVGLHRTIVSEGGLLRPQGMAHFRVKVIGLLRIEEADGSRIERPQRELERDQARAKRGAHECDMGREGPQRHYLRARARAR